MAKAIRRQREEKRQSAESAASEDALPDEFSVFGTDPLTERLRGMIGTFIEELVREELEEALVARRYQRGEEIERRGYRHTKRTRTLSTSMGPTTITAQRGRLFDDDGEASIEWQSKLLPRYQRRTRDVDDAIVNAYLSGSNTRRIRGALKPMLKNAPLSKSAISRAVRNLKASFDEWRTSRLDDKDIVFLYLDAISVKVRVDRKVQSMNMLVVLGVHRDGNKEVLSLMLVASESRNAWGAMLEDLLARGLREPILCIVDGSKGLRSALESKWAKVQVQRCVVHKLRNLEVYCPKRSLDDLRADFHAISEAESEKAAKMAYERFRRVWKSRSENVVTSLEEGGEELWTHYRFPRSMWKCLRTTNAIERLNGEFRRRLKTQASLPNESSALMVFYGVIASGQIRMRRIDGWQDIDKAIVKHQPERLRDAA